MEKQDEQFTGLPENAFRELKEGEKYSSLPATFFLKIGCKAL